MQDAVPISYPVLLGSPVMFSAWLRQQRRAAVVGYSGLAGHCPLTRFVREVTGAWFRADVGRMFYGNPLRPAWDRWPSRWPADFIGALDSTPDGTPVTARRALRVLQRVAGDQLPPHARK